MRTRVALLLLLAVGAAGYLYVPGVDNAARETTDRGVDFVTNVTTDPTLDAERLEGEIHEEVNEERRARGLEPLDRRGDLDRAARGHSRDLLLSGRVGHEGTYGSDPTDRVRQEGARCRAGENVLLTYFDKPTTGGSGETERFTTEEELAEASVDDWMNSPGHRENILRESYSTTGVGVAASAEQGEARVLVTQVFC